MALAERFPLEIVSVDSAQVYRLLDIGTAKPSTAERARVPHHLVDIVDPEDSYSAARFAADARRLVSEISARGRLPLLVGGTMLYAKALREGLHELPPASAALRAQLDREAEHAGWPALHARLASVDPATAARLAPGDSQRIQRALEVYLLTGQPLSHWIAQQRSDAAPPLEALRIALEPSDRSVLHKRIEARFRTMLAAGLIDEVRQLRERPTLHSELPAMRSVGYRQVWAWLDQPGPMEALANAGIAATRQLAKRQLTWLRSDPERVVIDCLAPDCADQVARHLISIS
jgi:tRNA dimethylallyltransferase